MDALLLARMQFAANISFHILFPTISIALGWLLLFFRWRWLRTQQPAWLSAYRLWTKVFALTFALGVVSGVTMSFQFGTNWPGFMEKAGNVAGPLLGYEVLTAFFLEASFLGIMLFGHGRVSERVHLMATFFVAFGTTLSAFWILALNSWMQTPQGFEMIDGEFHVDQLVRGDLQPVVPVPLHAHAAGVDADGVLPDRRPERLAACCAARPTQRHTKALRVGLTLAALVIPLQIFVGDLHGLNTLKHQPQKIAAIEGIWHTETGAPLMLFGWPDEARRAQPLRDRRAQAGQPDPGARSMREIKGLNEFPNAHPPVAPVFLGFRVMVGMGMLMLAVELARLVAAAPRRVAGRSACRAGCCGCCRA